MLDGIEFKVGYKMFGKPVDIAVPVVSRLVMERLNAGAILPSYASEDDSGMDVYSPVNVLVHPQETIMVPLGLRIGLPKHPFHDSGYRWELQNRPRSGLSLKTEVVVKFGTIDNGYRGEVGVIVKNDVQVEHVPDVEFNDYRAVRSVELNMGMAHEALDLRNQRVSCKELQILGLLEAWQEKVGVGTILIRKGDRIAQMVLSQAIRPLEIVEGTVSTDTDRGTGGFGHTGL